MRFRGSQNRHGGQHRAHARKEREDGHPLRWLCQRDQRLGLPSQVSSRARIRTRVKKPRAASVCLRLRRRECLFRNNARAFTNGARLKARRFLRGVFRQFGELLPALGRSNNSHFLPVISKLSAAIQTSHISSSQSGGLRTSRHTANRYRKAVSRVSAAEQCIHQFFNHDPQFLNHDPPSIPERVCRVLGCTEVRLPPQTRASGRLHLST